MKSNWIVLLHSNVLSLLKGGGVARVHHLYQQCPEKFRFEFL